MAEHDDSELTVTAGEGAADNLRERLNLDRYCIRVRLQLGPDAGWIDQDIVVEDTTTTDEEGNLILAGWYYSDESGITELPARFRWEDITRIHIY